MMFRRFATLRSLSNPLYVFRVFSGFSSRASSTVLAKGNESVHLPKVNTPKGDSFGNRAEILHLSPLFSESTEHHLKACRIEVVDNDSWQVSSGLAEAWKGHVPKVGLERKDFYGEQDVDGDIGVANHVPPDKENPDFDEIEDMRVRGNQFFKLVKDSKEYEDYTFDFHRKKSKKDKSDQKENIRKEEKQSQNVASGSGKDLNTKDTLKDMMKEELSHNYGLAEERSNGVDEIEDSIPGIHERGSDFPGKKRLRTPTFNQLTAPYHESFCLDIFVSKGSIRACIIHRATSKVVAVAHSISKDMKYDLGSTRSRSTCAAVGEVLAQRALADDIHNVVYTPRRGDKLEGKLQIVLQSIIDHGVSVKVKIKQRKARKGGVFKSRYE